jgi:hypothetical protein
MSPGFENLRIADIEPQLASPIGRGPPACGPGEGLKSLKYIGRNPSPCPSPFGRGDVAALFCLDHRLLHMFLRANDAGVVTGSNSICIDFPGAIICYRKS